MLSGIFAYSIFLSCSSSSAVLSLNNLWNPHDFLQILAVKAAESPRHVSLFLLISLQLTTIVSIQPPPSQATPVTRSISVIIL